MITNYKNSELLAFVIDEHTIIKNKSLGMLITAFLILNFVKWPFFPPEI